MSLAATIMKQYQLVISSHLHIGFEQMGPNVACRFKRQDGVVRGDGARTTVGTDGPFRRDTFKEAAHDLTLSADNGKN